MTEELCPEAKEYLEWYDREAVSVSMLPTLSTAQNAKGKSFRSKTRWPFSY